jgi:hypothetical protein
MAACTWGSLYEENGLGSGVTVWRIDNAKWTRDATLEFRKYSRPSETWDHDHCAACWAKFMELPAPDVLDQGYVTTDGDRWICPNCFQELKDAMGWKLV